MSEENKWLSQGETTKRYYFNTGSNSLFYSATVTFTNNGDITEIFLSSSAPGLCNPTNVQLHITELNIINELIDKIKKKEV